MAIVPAVPQAGTSWPALSNFETVPPPPFAAVSFGDVDVALGGTAGVVDGDRRGVGEIRERRRGLLTGAAGIAGAHRALVAAGGFVDAVPEHEQEVPFRVELLDPAIGLVGDVDVVRRFVHRHVDRLTDHAAVVEGRFVFRRGEGGARRAGAGPDDDSRRRQAGKDREDGSRSHRRAPLPR